MPDEVDRLFAAHGASPDPWVLPERRPTTLVALWPGDRPPTDTQILSVLSDVLEEELSPMDDRDNPAPAPAPAPGDGDDVLWRVLVESSTLGGMIGLWCETAKPLPEDEVTDPAARACRWVLGLQALLDESDPLTSFIDHVRLICAAAPDTPAVLDIESQRWHPRVALERWFLSDDLEPQADTLWIIHAVSNQSPDKPDEMVWLHTHGLWRCGRPELEMLQVPARHVEFAAELINTVGHLMLEHRLPSPGESMPVGPRSNILVIPWQQAVDVLPKEAPGSMSDRGDEAISEDHQGIRAVIAAPSAAAENDQSQSWTWPAGLLEDLASSGMPLFMTSRETTRRSTLAQHTWPELAMAWVRLSKAGQPDSAADGAPPAPLSREVDHPRVLIKAGYRESPEDNSGTREHLWFEIDRITGDRAHGRLVNRPVSVHTLHEGEEVWLDRIQISDWMVLSPRGRFCPDEAEQLLQSLDEESS